VSRARVARQTKLRAIFVIVVALARIAGRSVPITGALARSVFSIAKALFAGHFARGALDGAHHIGSFGGDQRMLRVMGRIAVGAIASPVRRRALARKAGDVITHPVAVARVCRRAANVAIGTVPIWSAFVASLGSGWNRPVSIDVAGVA